MIIPSCAIGFLIWINCDRVQRVEYVSNLADWSVDTPAVDPTSPTGYADGTRRLLVPDHNHDSYQWIATTQQMLASGQWRVRHVDYDNAPFGRELHSASPYRWWLALLAWCDHVISGRAFALSVEHVALFADPLLHLLLVAGTAIFVAWRFGAFPAALISIGLVTLFPWAAKFLPGAPDHHILAQICTLWSVLLLLAGISPRRSVAVPSDGAAAGNLSANRWFFLAGVAGGFGLWINLASQVPVIAGIVLGALMAACIARGGTTPGPDKLPATPPWQVWALGGGAMSLAAYLVEYFPANMGLRLEVIHPAYALTWIGGGELLARTAGWIQHGKFARTRRDIIMVTLAALALAAAPATIRLSGSHGVLINDPLAERLTNLPLDVVALNLAAWIARDGLSLTAWAMCLPVLLTGPAVWLLGRRGVGVGLRTSIALALGPVVVASVLAFVRLRWWNTLDGVLLGLLVAVAMTPQAAINSRRNGWLWLGSIGLISWPGVLLLLPEAGAAKHDVFTEGEVTGLIQRDLAHWLAIRAGSGGAVVLAPPALTTSLYFHGGARGLGTFYWENYDGLTAAIRIANASNPEDAQELVRQRGITHIIIPSWETTLDDYVVLAQGRDSGSGQPMKTFIDALHLWVLPAWLRPMPYRLAKIGGFEGQSVTVLEVVDEPDEAVALSRLTEYFIEMGEIDRAAAKRDELQRHPRDLAALVALAQVELALGDDAAFTGAINKFLPYLARGPVKALPFDRRVTLAAILAKGKRLDLARGELKRCSTEVDASRLRSLTTTSLIRFQILLKETGFEITDPQLRKLALELVPPGLRNRL